MNFFCNFETAPVNKVSLIFSSQNHTPLWPLPMLQWLILNCNQTLQVNFLAYYNNLFLLDKRSLLMKSFPFLMTGITKLRTQTQLHPPLPSSIHLHPAPSTSTQLISTSTQLHPPPPSSFQPPPSSLQHPQQYLNQNIARNWAISPNLGQKFKVVHFDWKLAHMVYWRCWFRIQT